MLRFLWTTVKWGGLAILLLFTVLILPIAYVETFCRAEENQPVYTPIVTEKEFTRGEANSYLTYPEWHIVYAYEGLANVLQTEDEYQFDYTSSVFGFWRSYCSLNQKANQHGGGEFGTRLVIYTIGASFTLEMALKALYEETVGRVFAYVRGDEKSPQDKYAAEMASDYATFLQQTPWYEYDFEDASARLWQQPLADFSRGWERRLALGLEFKAKSAYAGFIKSNAGLAGVTQLRLRSVIKNLSPDILDEIDGVEVIAIDPSYIIIETPRYRKLTRILIEITKRGAEIVEIAGNDDIMFSAIHTGTTKPFELQNGEVLSIIERDGFDSRRVLIAVKLSNLDEAIKESLAKGGEIEHIYDY